MISNKCSLSSNKISKIPPYLSIKAKTTLHLPIELKEGPQYSKASKKREWILWTTSILEIPSEKTNN